MTLQQAIAQLRSMLEKYEHEQRGRGPDVAETEAFLNWAAEQSSAPAAPLSGRITCRCGWTGTSSDLNRVVFPRDDGARWCPSCDFQLSRRGRPEASSEILTAPNDEL